MLLKKVYLILLMVAALAVFSGSEHCIWNTFYQLFVRNVSFRYAQEHFNCEFYLGNFTSFKIEPSERTL